MKCRGGFALRLIPVEVVETPWHDKRLADLLARRQATQPTMRHRDIGTLANRSAMHCVECLDRRTAAALITQAPGPAYRFPDELRDSAPKKQTTMLSV